LLHHGAWPTPRKSPTNSTSMLVGGEYRHQLALRAHLVAPRPVRGLRLASPAFIGFPRLAS
jgi:hypothetical protein